MGRQSRRVPQRVQELFALSHPSRLEPDLVRHKQRLSILLGGYMITPPAQFTDGTYHDSGSQVRKSLWVGT
jgi:hypothetical protein